jgi:hypothetical protein
MPIWNSVETDGNGQQAHAVSSVKAVVLWGRYMPRNRRSRSGNTVSKREKKKKEKERKRKKKEKRGNVTLPAR